MKHILGFSGGIDSQACARWLLNRYPAEDVILLNSDAGGNEDVLTVDFVRWYSENIHPILSTPAIVSDIWKTEGFAESGRGLDGNELLTFEKMIEIKHRPPSSKAQFCTVVLKLRPQLRWMTEQFRAPSGKYFGEDYERYTGKRRDESRQRAGTPDREWDTLFDCWLNHPIAEWTKEQCFALCAEHREPINPLYLAGFSRVGCAPCINASKEEILSWVNRRPETIENIRLWESRTGYTFFPPRVPGTTGYNKIDEVIRWAQTDRGGRQPNMFKILNERPSCESKYGLCE